jgi:hypothetical protein
VRWVESVAGIAAWKLNKREYSCLLVYDASFFVVYLTMLPVAALHSVGW